MRPRLARFTGSNVAMRLAVLVGVWLLPGCAHSQSVPAPPLSLPQLLTQRLADGTRVSDWSPGWLAPTPSSGPVLSWSPSKPPSRWRRARPPTLWEVVNASTRLERVIVLDASLSVWLVAYAGEVVVVQLTGEAAACVNVPTLSIDGAVLEPVVNGKVGKSVIEMRFEPTVLDGLAVARSVSVEICGTVHAVDETALLQVHDFGAHAPR